VRVQDNKGHHVIHSPHTDDTRQNAATAAAAAAMTTAAAESAASVDRWLYRSCCVVRTAAKTSLRYVPKRMDGKKLMNRCANRSRKKKMSTRQRTNSLCTREGGGGGWSGGSRREPILG